MNKTAKNYRNQAIEAEKKCREEMIKEFFDLNKKVINRLRNLSKTGKDEEAWIRLEGIEVDQEECYQSVSQWKVRELKKQLIGLKKVNIISSFAAIKIKGWASYIEELMQMDLLWYEISISDDALKELQKK